MCHISPHPPPWDPPHSATLSAERPGAIDQRSAATSRARAVDLAAPERRGGRVRGMNRWKNVGKS